MIMLMTTSHLQTSDTIKFCYYAGFLHFSFSSCTKKSSAEQTCEKCKNKHECTFSLKKISTKRVKMQKISIRISKNLRKTPKTSERKNAFLAKNQHSVGIHEHDRESHFSHLYFRRNVAKGNEWFNLIRCFRGTIKTLPKALRTQGLTALTCNFGLAGLVHYAW